MGIAGREEEVFERPAAVTTHLPQGIPDTGRRSNDLNDSLHTVRENTGLDFPNVSR